MFLMFTAEGTGSKTHIRTTVLPRGRSHALPVYLERTLNLGFGGLILERSGSEFPRADKPKYDCCWMKSVLTLLTYH